MKTTSASIVCVIFVVDADHARTIQMRRTLSSYFGLVVLALFGILTEKRSRGLLCSFGLRVVGNVFPYYYSDLTMCGHIVHIAIVCSSD